MFKKVLIKSSCILLIIGLNWTGLLAVGNTLAQFMDPETSSVNTFSAGILDFSLSSASNFLPVVKPTQTASRTINISKTIGSLGFNYTVQAANITGPLCGSINLSANLDGINKYTGLISGFNYTAGEFVAPGVWQFTATLTSSDSSLQSQTCSFDMKFNGRQIGMTSPNGFSDEEIISNTITAGTWQTCWTQTLKADFDAGTKTNIDTVAISDSAQLTTIAGSEQLDQSQYDENNYYSLRDSYWGAQTFTAGRTGKLSKIILRITKHNNPGPFVVEIRNVSNNKPGSIILGSVSVPASSINGSLAEINYEFINFSPEVNVTSGSQYAIVFHATGDSSNYYEVFYRNQNSYLNGSYISSVDNGANWTINSNRDFYFVTYVRVPNTYNTPGTLTSQVFDSGKITNWQSLSWNEILPAGTDIRLEARVSNNNNNSNWSSWYLLSSVSPIDLSSLPNSRYLQWRSNLSTSITTNTPVLQEVRTCYVSGEAFSLSDIVLNEFLPNPEGTEYGINFGQDGDSMPQGEWVEIYNKGNATVDLANWKIRDADSHVIDITASRTGTGSTVIGPNDWLVVYMNHAVFDNDHDIVKLYDQFEALVDSHSYDNHNYCDLEPTPGDINDETASGTCNSVPGNKSYARIPDGIGAWVDPIPTPGDPNILEEPIAEIIQPTETPVAEIVPASLADGLISIAQDILNPEISAPTETIPEIVASEEPVVVEEVSVIEEIIIPETAPMSDIIVEEPVITEIQTAETAPVIEQQPAVEPEPVAIVSNEPTSDAGNGDGASMGKQKVRKSPPNLPF